VTEAAGLSSGSSSSSVATGSRGRPLSQREQEIVRLLLCGDRVPSIARQPRTGADNEPHAGETAERGTTVGGIDGEDAGASNQATRRHHHQHV
jgi:hypothetical protein